MAAKIYTTHGKYYDAILGYPTVWAPRKGERRTRRAQ